MQHRRLQRERDPLMLPAAVITAAAGLIILSVLVSRALDVPGPTPSPTVAVSSPTESPNTSPPPTSPPATTSPPTSPPPTSPPPTSPPPETSPPATSPPATASPSPEPTAPPGPTAGGDIPPLPPEPTLQPGARSLATGELTFPLANGATRVVEVSELFAAEGEDMPSCATLVWSTAWSSVTPIRASILQDGSITEELGVGRWGTTYMGCAAVQLSNESGSATDVHLVYTLATLE